MEAIRTTLNTKPQRKRRGRTYAQGRALPGTRPQTREQWQEAVNGAQSLLLLDTARQYGLLAGGPSINQARCLAVLQQGAALSIRPRAGEVDALIVAMAEGRIG